ncbi:phosphoribosyl pyrophosphate synthase-associated protein 2 isoform X2 [Camelus bactrianus]|uniref:Phosphoribosyl pyrophosphate synthase-associated protein 2 n=2 Tax=Camelus bactrianus TaxID=9837 RepID=A0A9W3FPN1_CAMBA|nr:phosphoribosyl pyrophosphate synthase-associated protein 2 isoform X2 [Camelus bactrianus]
MFCVASPELEAKMNVTKGGLVLFSANSNSSCMELSKKIAERLGVEMGKVQVYQEPDRETRVQIQESVRGKDVFIIQTVSRDVNSTIMELLIMVYACKTSCAKSIIGVIPYFPYSKQCKMRKRGSIVSKLLASMMCKAGLTHLITMDLHQKEIQGFFNIPVDNLRASPFLLQYIQEEIPDYRNAVIVAKSPASAKRAQSFAERLRLGIAVIHGEAQDAESDLVDGRHSPPMVRSAAAIHPSLEIPMLIPKEKPPITVVGDVGGRIAIIVESHTVACTERSLFTWRDPLRPTLAECVGSSSPGSRAAVHVPGDHAWGLRSPAEGHLGRFQCSAVRSETLCTSACGLCGN